jgi:hypothetical protein
MNQDVAMNKKLGEILIERGFLTEQQVQEAIKIQQQYSTEGMWVYIGQILIDKGICTKEQIEEGLRQLKKI